MQLKSEPMDQPIADCMHSRESNSVSKTLQRLRTSMDHGRTIGDLNAVAMEDAVLLSVEYFFQPPQKIDFKNRPAFKHRETNKGIFAEIRLSFYTALSLLSYYQLVKKSMSWGDAFRLRRERQFFFKLFRQDVRIFAHYHFLIEAEYAFYRGSPIRSVTQLYRDAIQSAKEDENRFIEALVYERLGEYYLSLGIKEGALAALTHSRRLYSEYEAWTRVAYLEQKYQALFSSQAVQVARPKTLSGIKSSTSTTGSPQGDSLDYGELLKASRSLSGEVVFSSLCDKLMGIVSEVSGAERGVLFFPNHEGRLEKYLHFDHKTKSEDLTSKTAIAMPVPTSLIDRVGLIKEAFISPDASRDERLRNDPYFSKGNIRSVLCLPTLNRGKLIALLYLENNKVSGTFTDDRLKTLDVLASQAAISIENARLVQNLEEKIRQRTKQLAEKTRDLLTVLENLQQGIFTVQQDLTLHAEYSAHLEVILGETHLAGKNVLPLLFDQTSLGTNTKKEIEGALISALEGDGLDFDINRHLLPSEIRRTLKNQAGKPYTQFLELDWQLIVDNDSKGTQNTSDSVDKILVTVRDVTDLRKLQAESQDQRIELEMIKELLECGFESFQSGYQEARHYFTENHELLRREVESGLTLDQANQLFRNFHTVKGTLRMRGLSHAVEATHRAEEYLSKIKKGTLEINLENLEDHLNQAEAALERYFKVATDKLGSFGSV